MAQPPRHPRREILDSGLASRLPAPVLAGFGGVLVAFLTLAQGAEVPPGRGVFVAKGCARCHEERAVLQAPHVSALRRNRPLFDLATAMWNHAPMMWANLFDAGLSWPHLTAREMADLAFYLGGPKTADRAADPERGHLLFGQKGCFLCHAFEREGRTRLRDLRGVDRLGSDAAWAAALWNHAPSMMAVAAEGRLEYPFLEAKDLADIVVFLRNLSRPR